MQFADLKSSPLALDNRLNSAAHLPSISFSYFAPKNNISDHHLIAANSAYYIPQRPHLGDIYEQKRQQGLKVEEVDSFQLERSHRDMRRKKIFGKSHSAKDILSYSHGVIQEKKKQQFNRVATESNGTKRRNSRKRNNIFQSYDPKAKIQSSKQQLSQKNSEKMLNINFGQMVYKKRVINFQQLSSQRMESTEDQQIPLITINTANKAIKQPFRDTYVAERDCEYISQIKQQKELGVFKKRYMIDIPCNRIQRPFTKQILSEDISSKPKQFGVYNGQLQEESIIGQSHREVFIRNMQDQPQLLLQANENQFIFKAEQLNKPELESVNLIDSKMHIPNTFTTKISPIEAGKSSQLSRSTSNFAAKANSYQTLPYILVLLGALLLIIQLLN